VGTAPLGRQAASPHERLSGDGLLDGGLDTGLGDRVDGVSPAMRAGGGRDGQREYEHAQNRASPGSDRSFTWLSSFTGSRCALTLRHKRASTVYSKIGTRSRRIGRPANLLIHRYQTPLTLTVSVQTNKRSISMSWAMQVPIVRIVRHASLTRLTRTST